MNYNSLKISLSDHRASTGPTVWCTSGPPSLPCTNYTVSQKSSHLLTVCSFVKS